MPLLYLIQHRNRSPTGTTLSRKKSHRIPPLLSPRTIGSADLNSHSEISFYR
jgi:hypothetical protein